MTEVAMGLRCPVAPTSLQELSAQERWRVYRMIHLRVLAHRDDTLIAEWDCNVSL